MAESLEFLTSIDILIFLCNDLDSYSNRFYQERISFYDKKD